MTYPTMFVTTTVHARDRLVDSARVRSGQRPPVRCPVHAGEPASPRLGTPERAAGSRRSTARAPQAAGPGIPGGSR